ncbi:hypothetical protein GCM10010413_24640 [Promicromonospora sukumoe]
MRSRVSAATGMSRRSFSTNETVDCETPAARATSFIVGRPTFARAPTTLPTAPAPSTFAPAPGTSVIGTSRIADYRRAIQSIPIDDAATPLLHSSPNRN